MTNWAAGINLLHQHSPSCRSIEILSSQFQWRVEYQEENKKNYFKSFQQADSSTGHEIWWNWAWSVQNN
jgi:hypothetical protein